MFTMVHLYSASVCVLSFFFSSTRAEYGKYSVLVGHSGTRKRDRISEFREILMTEALNKIQIMDPETFKKKVRPAQKRLLL